ncbi:MAG: threonylcarbamoyl-AMP synthase [Prevotellaceae bacterium]|jgi:tRNA threonylcarbamoyl adenosine modification protein (Sua5/YciO/YrdC/YwlC family)|nr:threonylcarbamoyl-AMP synthase [Prevotellaceae bacterium]
MLLKIHPDNPNSREVDMVVQLLKKDGVAICPTDTVYAYICALTSKKAYDRLLQIKRVREKDANFSLLLPDLSAAAEYVKVDNQAYRTLKNNLPGPFTFILNPSGKVPDKLLNRRKSIGIRIPDNNIIMALQERLGCPLLATSIKSGDDVVEYETDPEILHEKYAKLVDVVIDGGFGGNEPSTIVNCTEKPYELVRQGKGELL